jgi:DNA-binding NtrC family response regulator
VFVLESRVLASVTIFTVAGKLKILIADDDVAAQNDWRETLAAWNYDVSFAEDGDKALELLESLQPHVLLCDLRMPRRNGHDLLAAMKERGLNIATLMISGVGQIDDAVRAIKLGAYDYLTKPVDLDLLEVLLKNLTSHVKLSEENQRLRRHLADAGKLGSIIGRSLPMRRVMALIDQVAPAPPPSLSVAKAVPARKSSPTPFMLSPRGAAAPSSPSAAPPSPIP